MAICPPRSYTPYKQDTRAADNNVCEMSTLETVYQNKSYLLTSSTISFTRVCIKRTLYLSLSHMEGYFSFQQSQLLCEAHEARVKCQKCLQKFKTKCSKPFWNVEFWKFSLCELECLCFWHVASLTLNNATAIWWVLHIVCCFFFVCFCICMLLLLFSPISFTN